jgi:hypothetical protein
MMEWLTEHVDLVSAVSSLGMLVIWILYLQLFFLTYQKQRRPNLFIHQASGFDLDSRCVVANMSETAVHVAAVLVDVERGEDRRTFQPRPDGDRDGDDPLSQTRQGPLPSASYMDVGSFGVLLDTVDDASPESGAGDDTVDALVTVRVVAFVGSELYPVGAERRFEVHGRRDGADVRPVSTLPKHFSNRRGRRIARRWLEEAQGREIGSGALGTPKTRPEA